jgi:hypothetical protein
LDGYSIELEIGNTVKLLVWSPNYDSQNRGTEELNKLFFELFEKINLSEYY